MEYNTQQPKLLMSEYGRNIQKMIDHALALTDRDERNRAAQAIISIMGQLNPHLRDVTDFKHKLWDHLFIISDFKFDVDSPYPKPTPETFQTKPERVKYPSRDIRYKHYGKAVEALIRKAVEMEEGEMKAALVEQLAHMMKRFYLTWNRDSVNDELIVQHIAELSKGKLKLPDNFRFKYTNDILGKVANFNQRAGESAPKQFKKSNNYQKNNFQKNNNNGNNGNSNNGNSNNNNRNNNGGKYKNFKGK
jgi:hypothetical protein